MNINRKVKIKDIVWTGVQGTYGPAAKVAKVGRIRIGSVRYNGIDKDPNKAYIASITLPGFESELGKYPSEELGVKKVEDAFIKWIKEISE